MLSRSAEKLYIRRSGFLLTKLKISRVNMLEGQLKATETRSDFLVPEADSISSKGWYHAVSRWGLATKGRPLVLNSGEVGLQIKP